MNARARNVGWRLDYFLVSPGLVERIQDVVILEDVPGSDHCPVALILAE
jgi:exodeoxyribonuclease-3